MKITPEIRAIKNAYLEAENRKDQSEMNRLKAKAMSIMQSEKTVVDNVKETVVKEDIAILKNEDGDAIEISKAGKRLSDSEVKL